jgi:hypothetical protein
MVRNRVVGSVIAIALAAPVGVVASASSADASSLTYSNCTVLTQRYHHGVAKSRKAAKKQVRQGYGMPAYGTRARKVYWANYKSLDRDKDGTACER